MRSFLLFLFSFLFTFGASAIELRYHLSMPQPNSHYFAVKIDVDKNDQATQEFKLQERQALYAHDIEIGKGAAQWVVNARAMVRPALTYGMFVLLVLVDVAGFAYAYHTGVAFTECLDQLWDQDTQLIWASIVAFWFGSQAFESKK